MWWTDCYLQNTLYMYMHVCVGNLLPTSSNRVLVSTLIPLKRGIFVERKFVKVFLSHNHQCDVVAIYRICPKFYPLQVVKEYQGCHMQPVFCLKPLNNYMYYLLFLCVCVCVCVERNFPKVFLSPNLNVVSLYPVESMLKFTPTNCDKVWSIIFVIA